ncbi:MAG: RNA polymerase sigma factor [Bacteroidales bacterium]|jgi:RNA polymerase sigma factor (sigma-70 family)|nr:RNA polymerase sigma factor [Bacteroidales bacterium]
MRINDIEFWDVAYRENAPAMQAVIRRYVSDHQLACDLLHEAFVTAINKYDSYGGKGNFGGWLYRIAVNTALMHLRKTTTQYVSTDVLTALTDDDEDADIYTDSVRQTVEMADFTTDELLSAIDRLPDHHKMVFNMYVMEGFSHKEIGASLKITAGTSKSHLARARKKIQQFLYEDALDKKKNKKRKYAGLGLIFPVKLKYIDRLYQAKLSDFTLPPPADTGFLTAALEQHAAQTAISQAAITASQVANVAHTAFWGSKLSYITLCCGTAAITGVASWFSMSENSPFNQQDRQENIQLIENNSSKDNRVFEDENSSLTDENKITLDDLDDKKFTLKNKSTVSEQKAADSLPPVVIKKQIIKRKTVVIRDTVIIQE